MIITWQLKQLQILIRGCPEGWLGWQTQLKAKDWDKTDQLQTFPAQVTFSWGAIAPQSLIKLNNLVIKIKFWVTGGGLSSRYCSRRLDNVPKCVSHRVQFVTQRLCPGGKADTSKTAQRSVTRTRVTPYTLIMPPMTSWTSSRFSVRWARHRAGAEWKNSRIKKKMCVWNIKMEVWVCSSRGDRRRRVCGGWVVYE